MTMNGFQDTRETLTVFLRLTPSPTAASRCTSISHASTAAASSMHGRRACMTGVQLRNSNPRQANIIHTPGFPKNLYLLLNPVPLASASSLSTTATKAAQLCSCDFSTTMLLDTHGASDGNMDSQDIPTSEADHPKVLYIERTDSGYASTTS